MKVRAPENRLRMEASLSWSPQAASHLIHLLWCYLTGRLHSSGQKKKIHIDGCAIKSLHHFLNGSLGVSLLWHIWSDKSPHVSRSKSQVIRISCLRIPGVSQVLEVDSILWLESALFVSVRRWQRPRGVAYRAAEIRSVLKPSLQAKLTNGTHGEEQLLPSRADALTPQTDGPPSPSHTHQSLYLQSDWLLPPVHVWMAHVQLLMKRLKCPNKHPIYAHLQGPALPSFKISLHQLPALGRTLHHSLHTFKILHPSLFIKSNDGGFKTAMKPSEDRRTVKVGHPVLKEIYLAPRQTIMFCFHLVTNCRWRLKDKNDLSTSFNFWSKCHLLSWNELKKREIKYIQEGERKKTK